MSMTAGGSKRHPGMTLSRLDCGPIELNLAGSPLMRYFRLAGRLVPGEIGGMRTNKNKQIDEATNADGQKLKSR
jgi:hypothetical protein